MLHRSPAGVFWLLAWKCRAEIALDSEHGAETTISTRGGVHTSRAIFGLPIQVVATVATHLLEVTAYSGSRAHAPIIGGEITIPLAARRSSYRRSASASGPSWYLGLLPLHPSGM
jgi:hypothetical protein